MNQISIRSGILGLLFFIIISAYGEVRLNPVEEIQKIARMEEPLAVDVLIRASLTASGTEMDSMDFYSGKLKELIDSAPLRLGTVTEDAEILLEWMHETVLTRYIQEQTALDTLLDNGRYNCVSSAVLYLILARSRDIPVYGVLTADHAFCRVALDNDDGGIDVETTTAYGFDPGTRRDAVDSFTGRTGFSYVPPGNYLQRQDIGEKELISLIYQNRLAALQRAGKWGDAIGLARDRWELSGSEDAQRDFRVSIMNYAADLDRRRLEIEGLEFLNEAALSLGDGHKLEETASALLGNAVTYHLRAGRTEEAEELLDNAELTAIVPEDFIESRKRETREKTLESIIRSAPFDEALTAVDRAQSDNLISQARWEEFSIYLWSNEARRRSSGGKWPEGWLFLQNASGKTSSISEWDSMVETYRHNAIVVYHNRFADALRKKKINEAREILNDADRLFPDSAVLLQDRETLANH